jgi:hypothetical protein
MCQLNFESRHSITLAHQQQFDCRFARRLDGATAKHGKIAPPIFKNLLREQYNRTGLSKKGGDVILHGFFDYRVSIYCVPG